MAKYHETLRGHGHAIFLRDRFQCRYCGFDGREFLSWHQLSEDHIVPRSAGGTDDPDNIVTCCSSCNSITSQMKFAPGTSPREIISQKCARVRNRHLACLEFWKSEVVQTYLRPCEDLLPDQPINPTIS
jgi:hypothetical protein